jgi:eukaryotic-like serine/threonine-protein kinase
MREPDLAISRAASYRRLRELASGGMGRVDLAVRREATFSRLCALKRLHEHLREDAEVRAMFLDEARIAGLIRHPNVISVVDLGDDEEGPFLVMEYVDGVAAGAIIERAVESGAAVPLEVALRIAQHAALGLHAAHDLIGPDGTPLSLVHRDVSPHNIIVGFDGVARVTDFGIAKALGRLSRTSTGILKGKLGYMSPEQLKFRTPDRRSDLFSLGVVLFELLAARRLYPGKLGEASALRILEEPAPDLLEFREDAPPELVGLMFQLLAKDPAQRPADARSVAHTLDAILLDIGAAGERTDTGEYLEQLFGAERRELAREVSAALAALEASSEDTPPPLSVAGRGRASALSARHALAAGAVLLIAGAGWAWLRAGRTEAPALSAAAAGPIENPAATAAAPPGPEQPDPAAEPSAAAPERSADRVAPRAAARAARPSSQQPARARGKANRDEPPRLWNWK